MRVLKPLAIGIGIGLILVLCMALFLSYQYRDKLAGYVLEQVNKQIETKVDIAEIDFTMLKKFPQASLELKDVLIYPTSKYKFNKTFNKDTLLYAKRVFLQFNIIYLLKNNFVISKIHVDQASVNLQINHKGQCNFDIIKKSKTKTEAISIDLNDVKLTRTNIKFVNEAKDLYVNVESYNSRIKGNLSANNYNISSTSELFINSIRSENLSFLKNTPADLNFEINVQNNLFRISTGEIKFKGQYFAITGDINATKDIFLDLKLRGSKLNIEDLKASLPDSIIQKVNMDVSGILFFQALVKGRWSVIQYPHISSTFGIHNGEFTRNGITISDLNFEGKYNNGKKNSLETSLITLDPVSFNIENDKVNGTIKIQNLKSPHALFNISATLDLQKINRFIKIPSISDEEGTITTNIKAELEIDNIKAISNNSLNVKKIQGNAQLNNLGFRWKNSKKRFQNMNGNIDIDQQIILKNITAKIANNDIQLNLTLDNIFEYINHKDTLYISGKIQSDYISVEEISSALSGDSKSATFALPDSLIVDCNLLVGTFKWQNFTCYTLHTRVIYKPQTFIFQNVSTQTMDGSLVGDASFGIENKNDIGLKVRAELTQINISKLFESFNNFGQTVLQDKHLKGVVKGTANFHSTWNNKFELYKEKIECDADIEIKNGELIDFTPLLALSKYIDVVELKHVRFAKLKNSIFIKDNVIHIPTMDIASNALDISLSGTHNFGNEYDYHITLSLMDVLFKKSQKKDEFGDVEEEKDGRIKTHLLIKGKNDKFEVIRDKKKAREEFATHLNTEKQTVKTILHEELGWFKKDTAQKVIPDNFQKKKIRVNWEEDDNSSNVKVDSTKKTIKVNSGNKVKVEWQDE